MLRSLTSMKESATRITSSIPSTPRSATESRCLTCPAPPCRPAFSGRCDPPLRFGSRSPLRPLRHLAEPDAVVPDVDRLVAARGQVLADVVGPDRELAMAAVDDDCQLHR